MTDHLNIYAEIAEFMASMNPEKVVAFKPSKANQDRLDILLEKQKIKPLSPEEESEVVHFLIINRIVGLAKARALHLLAAA